MKQLLKINNSDLSYRLNLNYNNVYSRLKMQLGKKASLFADISLKATTTTWYSEDDAEYTCLTNVPKEDVGRLAILLNETISTVRKELSAAHELSSYIDDILEVPDDSFVFYRRDGDGYKFILAGWGFKYAHQSINDPNSGFIKRISRSLEMPDPKPERPLPGTITPPIEMPAEEPQPEPDGPLIPNTPGLVGPPYQEPFAPPTTPIDPIPLVSPKEEKNPDETPSKKTQHVKVRVIDQNDKPVDGEIISVNSSKGVQTVMTSEQGIADVGDIPYGDYFGVKFPNIQGSQERTFEVEPGVDTYDAHVKKLIKYSPLLYIEDQYGNAVPDYNVKVVIKGQDAVYNSGEDGVIQLPIMQEGQKFVVIDTANYANTEEYGITQMDAKVPYHFRIKRTEQAKVGITLLDKSGSPVPGASIDLSIGDTPCQSITDEHGRAEFPANLFVPGAIPVTLAIKNRDRFKTSLTYKPDVSEYTIQLQGKKPIKFDWKWLSLIPLLLLLGWGGYELYKWLIDPKVHAIAEMEKGVVMTYSQTSYFVDLNVEGVSQGEVPLDKFYFTYNPNEGKIYNGTFDVNERVWGPSTGTGFLISEDGVIATNRHIADPIPPEGVVKLLKQYFQQQKDTAQKYIELYDDALKILSGQQKFDATYNNIWKALKYYQKQKNILDKVLNTGDFKVQVSCRVSVAFTGTRIQEKEREDLIRAAMKGQDLAGWGFHKCSMLKSGDPGTVKENDVAIIQLNSKAKDLPKDAYIFEVPENDLLDSEIPDDYEVTVLGYNAGLSLQDNDLQEGIKPQAQHGKITNTGEKYRVGYDASTIGGSSGSPVLNKKHELVAVNNSGIGEQGFAYGVRTKYLRELLDEIQKTKK